MSIENLDTDNINPKRLIIKNYFFHFGFKELSAEDIDNIYTVVNKHLKEKIKQTDPKNITTEEDFKIIERESETGECTGCTYEFKVSDKVFISPARKNLYCSVACYLDPKGKRK